MRIFLFTALLMAFLNAAPCIAEIIYGGGGPVTTAGSGADVSKLYLKQARQYRDEGRYELSRQSYAQALSTCRSNANLEIIKRELAGVELLIRTMR